MSALELHDITEAELEAALLRWFTSIPDDAKWETDDPVEQAQIAARFLTSFVRERRAELSKAGREVEAVTCAMCGEPMPPDEQMFKFHGYSGPCPKPPLPPAGGDHADPIARAVAEVSRILKDRYPGESGWRISIPARPNYDSDIILIDGLKVAAQLRDRVTTTAARLAEAEQRADRLQREVDELLARLMEVAEQRDVAEAIAREAGSHFTRLALRVETIEPTKAPAPSETAKASAIAARLAQIGAKGR